MEYADVAALSKEALNETAFAANLRNVDALAHVVRAFEDDSIPHVGPVDPLRDIKNIDFDLIVNDLGQVEKRLERVEKDLKKMKSPEMRARARTAEARQGPSGNRAPLREMEMTPEDKKRVRGFMFLSEKPMLYVLTSARARRWAKTWKRRSTKYGIAEVASRPNTGATRGLRQGRSRTGRDER